MKDGTTLQDLGTYVTNSKKRKISGAHRSHNISSEADSGKTQ